MSRILITGGSGFIGTNLVDYYINRGQIVLNIDWKKPKKDEHLELWKNIDILNFEKFKEAVLDFNPEYIIHLAARTDLDGKRIEDYSQNYIGVNNLLRIISELTNLKKIIITSSKFVTTNGYKIKNQFDYCPHTIYGESKVLTEREVWNNKPNCDWCIIRPTSIWGPWFGVPYRNFFDMVSKKTFFHIGKKKCYKTYGYIGNATYQIDTLLNIATNDEENKVFYIGDAPAYEINEWANEIASELGYKIKTAPYFIIKIAAIFGDFLSLFKIHFPIQSFRLKNMTNDGINDLTNTYLIAPKTIYTRLDGVKETLKWMENEKNEVRKK